MRYTRQRIRTIASVAAFAAFAVALAAADTGRSEETNGTARPQRSVDTILGELRPNLRSTQTLDREQIQEMFDYGADEGYMIFEVLNQMTMYLKERNMRAAILGEDLREAENRFSLGDEQIDVLLPVSKIDRVELGRTFGDHQAPFDVYMNEEHTDFLDVAYFDMEKHFGFATVEEDLFADGFGVRARRAFLRFRMSHMELQGDRRIRAHVHRFPRSRGMRFDAIERL